MVIEGTHYSPKCFCKNCKKIKIMDEKVSLRNEWNLALLRYAEKVGTEDAPESRRKIVTDISQAIATAVANREKEIAEEIKRMPLEYADSNNPLRVIEKILKIILNHK